MTQLPDEREKDLVPWAMQIALRVEKSDPPSDIDACEAAARACVAFLHEATERAAGFGEQGDLDGQPPRAAEQATGVYDDGGPDTSWQDAVDRWAGVAIRKVVRRARGKRWLDAQALPGVTITQHNAEARAFVPAPVRPLVPELAKMQVEGTDLPRGESTTDEAMVTVRVSPLVTMTTGKTAAQVAHAAQRAYEAMPPQQRQAWADDGFRVRVVRSTEAEWATKPGDVSIIDAGFTELEGQHETTRADIH